MDNLNMADVVLEFIHTEVLKRTTVDPALVKFHRYYPKPT